MALRRHAYYALFLQKCSGPEEEINRSMIRWLMIMAYCLLLLQNSLNLLEIPGLLIDVNLAIVYLQTNFFILKRIVKIIAILHSTAK